MGGGGIIIIRQRIKQGASLDQVRDCVPHRFQAKWDAILTKNEADWTEEEVSWVQHWITVAANGCW